MYNQNFIVDSLQNEKRLILGRARKSRAIHVRVYLKYEKKNCRCYRLHQLTDQLNTPRTTRTPKVE